MLDTISELSLKKRFKKVYFEIGNICNLQCSFCPEVERTKFQIEEEAFKKILLQLKPLADRVCFHLMGEPTAHKLFSNFVKIAEELNVPIEITTNGTALSQEISTALLNKTVVQVNFSLQSFFDNFPKAKPDVYLKKIFSFTKTAFQKNPDLYINYRLWNYTHKASDINKWVYSEIEKEFNVKINQQVDPGFQKSKRIINRLYLHFDTRFKWPSLDSKVIGEKGTCYGSRDHIGIHANGTVVPCCLDKEAVINLGNIYDKDINQILNSDRFKDIKKGFENGILKEDLCKKCDFVKRFSKKKGVLNNTPSKI